MTGNGIKLNLIAAVCENSMGIGKNDRLPWHLPNEMNYFTTRTTKTADPERKNAVVMGRVTWESVPPKYKPFRDRINIIISKSLEIPCPQREEVIVCRSFDEVLDILSQPPLVNSVETVWNIGGSSIYKLGMESSSFYRLFLTRIYKHFDCDTFFPEISWSQLKEISLPDVPRGVQEENGIRYEFFVYERI